MKEHSRGIKERIYQGCKQNIRTEKVKVGEKETRMEASTACEGCPNHQVVLYIAVLKINLQSVINI